ncbi:S8 family serine peptidase [Aquipuribacter sp. MA13-13]|uniref:S8 family serine peptidase n=1 Tax=Aquipuribacter sp. MA13-13 TaxID=3440840 RepID=UPI003EEE0D55
MSIVDPWTQVRPQRTSTRTAAPTTSRLVGAAVTGLACLTLATLVTGIPAAQAAGTVSAPDWSAVDDPGSAWSIARQIGAHEVWSQVDPADPARGLTGHGVTIAVVDTGVGDVEGLGDAGKVTHAVDLSRAVPPRHRGPVDGMGHGTHMAGLAAGRDDAVVPGQESDPQHFVGMAPDAAVVDVKVGGADGRVGVDQVVDGIDWVVAHREEHGIRVLNLSYSATTADPAGLVRLADAVEDARDAGVLVVAAAGNDGTGALTMPAAHPSVLAVGSTDHSGTASTADDEVGAWTNPGTAHRRPDLLAPGRSVAGLRLPGSLADREHPEGLVAGDRSGRLFRGTGTSQSAAVVSGAAALLLQADPTLTPDEVRDLLTGSARRLVADDSPAQGAGLLDVAGAVDQALAGQPGASSASALGRGDVDLAAAPAAADHRCTEWAGRSWAGRSWTGRSWTVRNWPADDWSGRSWTADD